MPPKRGTKRKANAAAAAAAAAPNASNGDLAGPDRNTWPGWVEMESEPAFFNVMLREMGAQGVRIQEVISMDPDMLALLPHPVHAFIFLFRYKNIDEQDATTGKNEKHIWFANQIPDFACASVAMLNVVNNIPGLEMGKELRDFKIFTQNMTPMQRGDAIDNFDFVKRIHNSFATENDILNANMFQKAKVDKFKKKQATAKAQETKRAKKAEQGAKAQTAEASSRGKKPTKAPAKAPKASTAKPRKGRSRSAKTDEDEGESDDGDDDFDPKGSKAKGKKANGASAKKANGAATNKMNGTTAKKTNGIKDEDEAESNEPRRSGRARKPPPKFEPTEPPSKKPSNRAVKVEEGDESGFHFVAYMPIGDHVWKLDGLNRYPQDMGSFGEGCNGPDGGTGNWIDTVSPAMMQRMEDFGDGSIEFTLMAVVHDPAADENNALLTNIKAIQAVETKLSAIVEDWHELEGGETRRDVITGMSPDFGITQADVDAAELPTKIEEDIAEEDGLVELLAIRGEIITQQTHLRANLRDAMTAAKADDEKARHRRHDYGKFVRSWLGELAAQQVLADLI